MWGPNARHRGGPCFLLLTLRWLGWTEGRLIFGVCHCTLETVAIQSAHPLLWARFDKGHGYTWLQSYGSGGILAIPWEGPKETGRNRRTTGLTTSWHCSFCQVHKQHELCRASHTGDACRGRGRERERGISSELADMTCCELHLRCRHRHCRRRRCRCCRCCCFWSSFSFSFSFLFLFVLSLPLSLSLLSSLSSLSSLSPLSSLSSSSSSSAPSSSSASSLLLLLLWL